MAIKKTFNNKKMASLIKEFKTSTRITPKVNTRILDSMSNSTRISFWSASKIFPVLPSNIATKTSFSAEFSKAWSEMFFNLAHWEDSHFELTLPRLDRVLIVGWHFPELPLLFNFALKTKILLLISQDALWLNRLKTAGCTLNFRTVVGQRALVTQMSKGRNIGTMMDHVHPETKTFDVPLFSRLARTPSGIFDLCRANNYILAFIAPRGEQVKIIHTLESNGHTSTELATKVNEWLEEEVKKAPERWLMWQALNFRLRRTV